MPRLIDWNLDICTIYCLIGVFYTWFPAGIVKHIPYGLLWLDDYFLSFTNHFALFIYICLLCLTRSLLTAFHRLSHLVLVFLALGLTRASRSCVLGGLASHSLRAASSEPLGPVR